MVMVMGCEAVGSQPLSLTAVGKLAPSFSKQNTTKHHPRHVNVLYIQVNNPSIPSPNYKWHDYHTMQACVCQVSS